MKSAAVDRALVQNTLEPACSVLLDAHICAHCSKPIPERLLQRKSKFCCNGCQTVYRLLNQYGLSDYYKIRNQTGQSNAFQPVQLTTDTYAYLDDADFKKKFAHGQSMDFYLEGVHCAACIWLVEKLPEILPEVDRASLDIGKAVAKITLKQDAQFAGVAKALENFGYKPHPVEHDAAADAFLKSETRRELVRLGIAGACTGNIMLLTVPLYSGVDGSIATWFRWISAAIFAPVFFYCAIPFYKAAWSSIRSKTISIDLPIALAIIFGAAASLYNLAIASNHLYFDSLAALVFLLLSSRFVLRRLQQKAFQATHLMQFLSPAHARRVNSNGQIEQVSVATLLVGDEIEVQTGDALPADGILLSDHANINCALLTGEAAPQSLRANAELFSGTVNDGENIRMRITALSTETRLGKILRQIENGVFQKVQIVSAADRTAKWFLVAVLAGAIGTILFSPTLAEGFSRALALVIVTCPCALALATPLTMSVAMGKAARAGLLVKTPETLEKIYKAKAIVLDKTGTLTMGQLSVTEWKDVGSECDPNLRQAIAALEATSKHPVGHALRQYLESETLLLEVPSNFKEILGEGVEGSVYGAHYSIKALRTAKSTAVAVYKNDTLTAEIYFGDKLREDAKESLAKIHELGLTPHLLSGDNYEAVKSIANEVGISPNETFAQASPEQKQKYCSELDQSIMVGDGANDAPALSSAFVGIAVRGSVEVSLRAADVYLNRSGVQPIVQLLKISHSAMHTIYRNFGFSLFYNVAGAAAALSGHVTPLFAAVLMPLSAFTVFFSALYGSKK